VLKFLLSLLSISILTFGYATSAYATTAKLPVYTYVDQGGACPNGGWSVVEDSDADGCWDHVSGRDCWGNVVDESYTDSDCNMAPPVAGPYAGTVTAGTYSASSSAWQITLRKNSVVVGYMTKASGTVTITWVSSSIANPISNGNGNVAEQSTSQNDVSARSVTKLDLSPAELKVIQDKMVARLTNRNSLNDMKVENLAVTAHGTAFGVPNMLSIQAKQAGRASLEIINLTSVESTPILSQQLVMGVNQIEINLGNLASGAYMIVATQNGTRATTSFTVAK